MAPASVKRRRLDSSNQSKIGIHSTRDGSRIQEDLDEVVSTGDESDHQAPHQAPGVSYSALLSSLQTFSGRKTKKYQGLGRSKRAQESARRLSPPSVESELKPINGENREDGNGVEDLQDEYEVEDEGEIDLDPNIEIDEGDDSDPFEVHFANPDGTELSERLAAVKRQQWSPEQIRTDVGKHSFMDPAIKARSSSLQHSIPSLKELRLKHRLVDPGTKVIPALDVIQKTLAPSIFNYRDLLYCGRTPQNADSLRNLACLHALNHVFKTRDRIIKNTTKLARNKDDTELDLRDQGFTRPKILVLLETRNACGRYMETITKLCDPEQQENKKRFQDAFLEADSNISEDKPLDFRELFEGNDDNEFRLGIKFTRKTIKYYSQFYSSDIIFASPLGLRRAINADDARKSDYDFLSSIELVIVDQADAMLMQNWEHAEFVFEYLNLQPKEAHDCDFSRVRFWYLEQAARHLRQTIVFSAYLTPELNRLFSSQMQNVAGKEKLVPEYDGVIQDAGLQIRQTFARFRSASPASDPDDRFKYFTATVIPQLVRQGSLASGEGLGALIFIPSYLDFVRVRNYFSTSQETQNLTFGSLSEYTDLAAARRGRSHFLTGKQSVMLYTGRAHHFRRYRIRGVKRVILYGLPDNHIFFNEITTTFLGATIAEGKIDRGEATVRAMFSKWDSLALERIVGGKRASRMLKDIGGDTFEFR